MGKDSQRHDEPDNGGCLETDTNCNAIKEAMRGEREGSERSARCTGVIIFLMRMKKNESIENEIAEESNGDNECDGGSRMIFRPKINRFGEKIKERDTGHRTGRETKYEMELVAELEGEKTTDECRNGRSEREAKDKHAGMIHHPKQDMRQVSGTEEDRKFRAKEVLPVQG